MYDLPQTLAVTIRALKKALPSIQLLELLLLAALLGQGARAEGQGGLAKGLGQALKKLGYHHQDLPACEPAEVNSCQQKASGGHAGTIFATKAGWCAKKIRSLNNVNEVAFYRTMEKRCHGVAANPLAGLCPFLPAYKGLCLYKGGVYLQISNLKTSIDGGHPSSDSLSFYKVRVLDLKIGRKTASMAAMGTAVSRPGRAFWGAVHHLQDRFLTSSYRYGMRFAGASPPLAPASPPLAPASPPLAPASPPLAPASPPLAPASPPLAPASIRKPAGWLTPWRWYRHPPMVLRDFFAQSSGHATMAQACLASKVEELRQVVADASFATYHLSGASLLLLYNEQAKDRGVSCGVFVIDFANSLVVAEEGALFNSQRRHGQFVEGFRFGVEELARLLAEPKFL